MHENKLLDSESNMYLNVDSLIDTNNIVRTVNEIILQVVLKA